mmetsp:Transcript_52747/g.99022  ORF Transcript_52747/g.99022 Transcript_52747/m.99022 type:complete len:377 (+) Transcript_52747:86-1216(+)
MANPKATLCTSMGRIEVEIYLDRVPLTASNFIDLAQSGFYDGLCFQRVIPNFMVQFGCPHAKAPEIADKGDADMFVQVFEEVKARAEQEARAEREARAQQEAKERIGRGKRSMQDALCKEKLDPDVEFVCSAICSDGTVCNRKFKTRQALCTHMRKTKGGTHGNIEFEESLTRGDRSRSRSRDGRRSPERSLGSAGPSRLQKAEDAGAQSSQACLGNYTNLLWDTGSAPDGTFKNLKTGATEKRTNGGHIKDEHISKDTNEPGTLSMANTGQPNTASSQFFINAAHNGPGFLDWFDSGGSRNVVFGKVIKGYDIIEDMTKVKTSRERPVKPIYMHSILLRGLPSPKPSHAQLSPATTGADNPASSSNLHVNRGGAA